jgi:hypothetical protein
VVGFIVEDMYPTNFIMKEMDEDEGVYVYGQVTAELKYRRKEGADGWDDASGLLDRQAAGGTPISVKMSEKSRGRIQGAPTLGCPSRAL